MIFQPKRLDVDIEVDRSKKHIPDPIDLTIPDEMSAGQEYELIIQDYNPKDTYDITFSDGDHQFDTERGVIIYQAPTGVTEVDLDIHHIATHMQGSVIFPDGSSYDEYGKMGKVRKHSGKNWEHAGGFLDYQKVESTKSEIEAALPPIPAQRNFKEPDPIRLGEFDLNAIFGTMGSKQFKKVQEGKINGAVFDYYLPSESEKRKDEKKYLYDVEGDEVVGVPRNSNVTGSGGDVFSGYRSKGDVGSSLKIIRRPDEIDRWNHWKLEIQSDDLEALMPDDIIALCLTGVTFSPILRGNPKGHTFWWEQVSGDTSNIIWLTPRNQPEISLELGPLKVDRVFRFWIDKGTKREKHYDIAIYGTPFERLYHLYKAKHANDQGNFLNMVRYNTTPILLSYQNVWNKQLRIQVEKYY